MRSTAVSSETRSAGMRTRTACTDKAGYNLKCECSVEAARGTAWKKLHFTCDIHATSTAHTRTFQALHGAHVSGLLRVALSLQQGSTLQLFRRCLQAEIRKRLKLYQGHPPAAATAHRNKVLKLFMSDDDATTQVQRVSAMLDRLPSVVIVSMLVQTLSHT